MNVTRAFSAPILFNLHFLMFKFSKKGKKEFSFGVLSFYGCFLVTSIATTVMPTMKIMTIATIAYMTVVFEAKSLTGVAVGADVDGGGLA